MKKIYFMFKSYSNSKTVVTSEVALRFFSNTFQNLFQKADKKATFGHNVRLAEDCKKIFMER